MSSVKNCGKSSATKTVKGFTLIELLIVIAIIAILAGISSVLIQGFVRDARLETANNKAQQVYSAVQNTLIQFEITQDYKPIDAYVLNGKSDDETAKYIELQFEMKNGTLNGSDVTVTNLTASSDKTFTYSSSYDFPTASVYADDNGRRFSKLAKYLCDSLSEDFDGYAFVCIDMENYVVDSVVFSEDARVKTNGVLDFANTYKKTGSTDGTAIKGCDDVFDQKAKYNGKDTTHVNARGIVVGFYPMMNDMPSGTFTKN